jgi:hypothetical protein
MTTTTADLYKNKTMNDAIKSPVKGQAQNLRGALKEQGYKYVPGNVPALAGTFWAERRYKDLPLIKDRAFKGLWLDTMCPRTLELRQLPDGDIGLYYGEGFETWTKCPEKIQEIKERSQISGYRWHPTIAAAIIGAERARVLTVNFSGFGARFVNETDESACQYCSSAPFTGKERSEYLYKHLIESVIPFVGKRQREQDLDLVIALVEAMDNLPSAEWCIELISSVEVSPESWAWY